MKDVKVEDLKGLTLVAVLKTSDDTQITFEAENGDHYYMNHVQDCCEHVRIESIVGDLDDLVGSPLLMSESVSSENEPAPKDADESYTWTFYKLATIKGGVTIRWLGESNGYYSESVSFYKE